MNARLRLPDWLFLLALCAYFFFWRLAAFGLIGADEPRYAQVAREMFSRRDWVTPTLSGTAWLEKPPLYYWQAMLAYRVFGVSDWAARLPSAFDALLLIFAVYFFLRRFRPESALDGAVILATTAGIVGFSRAASMDMALTAMLATAMLAWYAWFEAGKRRDLLLFNLFLALAVLAKGPVALFLALVVIAVFAATRRSLITVGKTLWVPGILLFCGIAVPWYVLVQIRNPKFFHEFIIEHNLARFGTNLYHHPEPSWYYIPVTLIALAPWAWLALSSFARAVQGWGKEDSNRLSVFLVTWIVVIVVFFSISRSKLPGYILPVVPAGAILTVECARYSRERLKYLISVLHALLLGTLLFCALMVHYLILQHRIAWSAAAVPLAASIAITAVIFALLIKSDFRALRVVTLGLLIIAVAVGIRFGSQPLDESLSARPVATALANFDRQHLPAAVFLVPRETEFGLAFYRDQIISRYELGEIPPGEHLVVAAQGFEQSIARATGRRVTYLGSFPQQKLQFFYVAGR